MKRTRVYDGRIIGLSLYDVMVGGRKVKREVIEHPGAAAVIAFDEKGKLIMVKQDRFPYGHTVEIPAGTLEKGEDPEACAFRELREETGYAAKRMVRLIAYHPSIGYNTEVIHCFVASGVKRESGRQADADEILSVERFGLKKVMQMIRAGRIQDSKTVCAVMTYAVRKRLY